MNSLFPLHPSGQNSGFRGLNNIKPAVQILSDVTNQVILISHQIFCETCLCVSDDGSPLTVLVSLSFYWFDFIMLQRQIHVIFTLLLLFYFYVFGIVSQQNHQQYSNYLSPLPSPQPFNVIVSAAQLQAASGCLSSTKEAQ